MWAKRIGQYPGAYPNQTQMLISTIGLPGSGKTTIGKLVAAKFGMDFVQSGDVARKLAETNDAVAKELANGRLAPRDAMNKAMEDHIRDNTVLDGYPRYMAQLADLYRVSRNKGLLQVQNPIIFLWVHADPEDVWLRLSARNRADDTPMAIAQRIDTFQTETRPVLEYLFSREENVVFVAEGISVSERARNAINYIQDQWT